MKKLVFTMLIIFVTISQILAQTPQSFKYQAVVRDGAGTVIANQMVGFQLSILQTNETGNSVYTETFTTTTNSYGLVNLNIGEGTPVSGDFTTIDWGADSYFLKVELDETGGTNYTHIGTSKLNSVPYALHAKTAETAGNVFSGDYNDLNNTPDLSNYDSDVTDDFDGDYNSLTNKPTLQGDVTGNIELNKVEKIQGKNVSTNTPSSGQVLKWNGTEWAPAEDDVTGGSGVDGVVNSASFAGTTNKTLTLGRSNGLGSITANFTDEVDDADNNATNEIQILSISNDTIYLSDGGYVKLPAGFDGDYNNLTNQPTIPTNTSDLTNDSGFITNPDDADADATNELQTISKTGNTVTLSNSGGSFTDEVNDADASSTNELITNATLNGTDLQITDAGGTKTVDLSSLDNSGTDSQTLSVSGTSLTISGGNTVTLQDNVNDADADATNELQTLSEVLTEGNNAGSNNIDMNNQNITNAHILGLGSNTANYLDLYYGSIRDYFNSHGTNGQVLTSHEIGSDSYVKWETPADNSSTNELQVLNFSNDTLYLSDGGQVYMGAYGNLWNAHGNDIYNTNTRNVGVGLENPEGKLVVQGDSAVSDTLPLFEVKNKHGITVFAVYDGGIRMYVNDDPAKANNDKGGFAIGGYRLDKSITNEYMRVTPDSVRIYIKEENTNKANNDKGGFAIGGYRLDKTTPDDYLHVFSADTAYVIDTTAQMLWYPLKEAFLSGKVLVESSDSVGQNSWATGYVSKSIGDFSQALGNEARAYGESSTAIGYHANSIGNNSYSFGNYATAQDSGSYAIGSGAKATGLRSFALGSTGVDSSGTPTSSTIASGDYSYAIGMGARAYHKGSFAMGTETHATGSYSLGMGYKSFAGHDYSISIGYQNTCDAYMGAAIGAGNRCAYGYPSFTFGINNYAEQQGIAIGFSAKAFESYFGHAFSFGYNTIANENTMALGFNNIAKTEYETVVGVYNDTVPVNYYNPIFTIGAGTDNTHRKNIVTVTKSGMGIGTKAPEAPLDIETNSSGYALHIEENGTGTEEWQLGVNTSGDLNFYDGTTVRAVFKDYGYLGIGTTTPGSHRLAVKSSAGGVSGGTGYFENTASNGLSMIIINSNSSSTDNALLVTQKGTGDIASFDSYHGTTGWDREFRFTNTGDGRCDGSWIAGGADYAEFFPKADITKEYEVGDIITMSPIKAYTAEGATINNDKLILGVYSSNPAIIGNSQAEKDPENSVLVGLVGVIKTKINTENGPIKIGDFITISSTPKVGMKATENCMVVGRAMDNYDKDGTGLINVLVKVEWYYNTAEDDITSSGITDILKKQEQKINSLKQQNTAINNQNKEFNNSLNSLKAEVEQLKQILEVKAQK